MRTKKNWWFLQKPYNLGIILFIIALNGASQSQRNNNKDFSIIFKPHYQEALYFFDRESWIEDSLKAYMTDPQFLKAIVFPEVMRYSALLNFLETQSLEVLYCQYGNNFANFSIGRFQMKPEFIETLEKEWNALIKNSLVLKKIHTDFSLESSPKNRFSRIKRMDDIGWQIKYLAMFYHVTETRFSSIKWNSAYAKLRFFATAYNVGFKKTFQEIKILSSRHHFYTTLLKPTECFNYSEISEYYYRNIKEKISIQR